VLVGGGGEEKEREQRGEKGDRVRREYEFVPRSHIQNKW